MISEWHEWLGCPNCGIVPYTFLRNEKNKIIYDSSNIRPSRKWCHAICVCSRCKQEYNSFERMKFKQKVVPDIEYEFKLLKKSEKEYEPGEPLW